MLPCARRVQISAKQIISPAYCDILKQQPGVPATSFPIMEVFELKKLSKLISNQYQ